MKIPTTLRDLLVNTEHKNFTGKVFVKSQKSPEWKFYFLMGKLIWVNGGYHCNRSWLRHLVKFCPEQNCQDLGSATKSYYECNQYQTLYLLDNKRIVNKETVKSILEARTQEKFFDILQESNKHGITYTLEQDTPSNILNFGFKPALVMIDYYNILDKSQQQSTFFSKSSLKNISLNYAPKISDSNKLQEKLDLETYSYFIKFFNGQLSLRDLALRLNKNVIKLALSLTSYEKEGIIKYQEIEDVNYDFSSQKYGLNILQYKQSSSKFAVACIDNNKQLNREMNKIVNNSGGRFTAITDEFQAITSLLEFKPDIIFINISMPVVNGYELCSQIKRVEQFHQTPIIMMSESKSIADRVRNKLVGASDFITKPLDESRIIKIIEKFTADSPKSEVRQNPRLAFS